MVGKVDVGAVVYAVVLISLWSSRLAESWKRCQVRVDQVKVAVLRNNKKNARYV